VTREAGFGKWIWKIEGGYDVWHRVTGRGETNVVDVLFYCPEIRRGRQYYFFLDKKWYIKATELRNLGIFWYKVRCKW
jgi:hypothetical protein